MLAVQPPMSKDGYVCIKHLANSAATATST
jgi:hypothetical protein